MCDFTLALDETYIKTMPKMVGFYENSGIDIIIVGTGFAGLTAALECTRKGHNVRLLERNSTTNMAGTFLDLLLNEY